MPYRAETAAEVFRAGYAPEVWMSRSVNAASETEELGICFGGEEEYSREVLVREDRNLRGEGEKCRNS